MILVREIGFFLFIDVLLVEKISLIKTSLNLFLPKNLIILFKIYYINKNLFLIFSFFKDIIKNKI